jgi:hypothetical protein
MRHVIPGYTVRLVFKPLTVTTHESAINVFLKPPLGFEKTTEAFCFFLTLFLYTVPYTNVAAHNAHYCSSEDLVLELVGIHMLI